MPELLTPPAIAAALIELSGLYGQAAALAKAQLALHERQRRGADVDQKIAALRERRRLLQAKIEPLRRSIDGLIGTPPTPSKH